MKSNRFGQVGFRGCFRFHLVFGRLAPALAVMTACGSVCAGEPRVVIPSPRAESEWSPEERAIRKCLDSWVGLSTSVGHSSHGTVRGWPSRVSPSGQLRFGEAGQPIPSDVVCLKNPGTATMGLLYLTAHRVLGEPRYLKIAGEVGGLLLAGQTEAGGWGVELWVGPSQVNSIRTFPGLRFWPDGSPPGVVRGNDVGDLADSPTLDAMEFLYQLWWMTGDERYQKAWLRGLQFHLRAQDATGGGFPEAYPADDDWRGRASFYGDTASLAVRALRIGYERTGEREYLDAVIRCADWVLSVKKAGQGWGMRYDREGNLAEGQPFEPPGLSTIGTRVAISVLGTAYEYTANEKYVLAIKDAVSWLNGLPTAQGVYANFYHPETNRPWFRDGEGRDVPGFRRARAGYPWMGDWGKEAISLGNRLASVRLREGRQVPPGGDPSLGALTSLSMPDRGLSVERILATQDASGVWPVEIEGAPMLTVRGTYFKVLKLCAAVARQRGLPVGAPSFGDEAQPEDD